MRIKKVGLLGVLCLLISQLGFSAGPIHSKFNCNALLAQFNERPRLAQGEREKIRERAIDALHGYILSMQSINKMQISPYLVIPEFLLSSNRGVFESAGQVTSYGEANLLYSLMEHPDALLYQYIIPHFHWGVNEAGWSQIVTSLTAQVNALGSAQELDFKLVPNSDVYFFEHPGYGALGNGYTVDVFFRRHPEAYVHSVWYQFNLGTAENPDIRYIKLSPMKD